MAIEDPEQIEGLWWAAHYQDEAVHGTLSLDPGTGIRLDLRGAVTRGAPGSLPTLVASGREHENAQQLVVAGQARDGTLYTLWDGFIKGRKVGSGKTVLASCVFNRGLCGLATASPNELLIDDIAARFHGLNAWLDISPFRDDARGAKDCASIAWQRPDELACEVGRDKRLLIQWDLIGPNIGIASQQTVMTSRPWFNMVASSPVPLDEALEEVAAFEGLLTVLTGHPTRPLEVRIKSPDVVEDTHSGPMRKRLRALYHHPAPPGMPADPMPHRMLLPRPQLGEQWTTVVPKWWRTRSEHFDVIAPYLAYLRMPPALANDQFFGFARVAEGVHRRFGRSEQIISAEHFTRVKQAITEALPEDMPSKQRQSLLGKLKLLKEPSFRQRLRGLLNQFPSLVAGVIGNEQDQHEFIIQVGMFRDDEAHILERSEFPDGSQLVAMASKLRVLIDAWVLREMGIDPTEIEAAMRNTHDYWFYADASTWPWRGHR